MRNFNLNVENINDRVVKLRTVAKIILILTHVGECAISKVVEIPSAVVFDSMHQVHLGVARHLVFIWLSSVLKKRHLEEIDVQLSSIEVPHDITRRPRSLQYANTFKAQEWKRFLLYIGKLTWKTNSYGSIHSIQSIGPLVLQDVLRKDLFLHFLLLSAAIYKLSGTRITQEDVETARNLLNRFHTDIQRLYDSTAYTYNAHSLLHLPGRFSIQNIVL